ncbi:MAG TPA: ribosome-associated translation inhibitor RaiA [Vicinamibacterales bacterium]|nr:ribosome-associated translation inhibitor RaiA [Vicinamibacterales bacterium]
MKLSVTGRHVAVSDAVREGISSKVRRLDRVLNDSAVSAQCVIARERQLFVCELTVHARGDHMLHAVARHARLPSAVTAAVDKVGQQAARLSDRWKTRRRTSRPARAAALGVEPAPERSGPLDSARGAPRVVRSRLRAVKPMSLDDALLALSDAQQNFLVFRRAESDAVAILYRRPDGDFGLIEPEG